MFSDPVSITYATVAKNIPRIGMQGNKGVYLLSETDGTTFTLDFSQETTKLKRRRCTARLQRAGLLTNPLVSGQSRPAEIRVTVTVDRDELHTPQDAVNLLSALRGFLSDANILRLAAGEV